MTIAPWVMMNSIPEGERSVAIVAPTGYQSSTHNYYLCRPMTEEVTLRFAQGDKTIIKKNEDV